jgi:hypothetical protein
MVLALFYSRIETIMRSNSLFPRLLFLATLASLLYSCNLRVSVRNGNLSPTPLPIPSATATPVASPTSTFTPFPTAPLLPTPTLTLFFAPTVTPTRQWSACPGIVVTQTDTDQGDMLHILRCEDGLEYDLGPLPSGVFAVGPNDKFLIYAGSNGIVYGSRIGEPHLFVLYNLVREHIFTVFNIGSDPDFKISFSDGDPVYKLVLVERNYDQKRMYDLPARLTH